MGADQSTANMSPEEVEKFKKDRTNSANIDQKLQNDKVQEDGVIKLLLLGAGESGKSTLFKQAVQLYGKKFDDNARATYRPVIHGNIIEAVQTLVTQCELAGANAVIADANKASKQVIMDLKKDQLIDEDAAVHIKALWKDDAVQRVHENRSKFQLIDSAAYLLNSIDDIIKKDYIPSFQDVIRCRARTTSIVQTELTMNDNKFLLLDVGGQRSQRKKWIHCFEGVTAVIFVAAISEYDQVLMEDNETSRAQESLQLFGEICNSKWFQRTHMILFLNKKDLFEEKIKRVSLAKYFPDYAGGANFDDACDFMKTLYHKQSSNPDKKIYTHITCATDTENASFVFNAVKDIIIRQRMGSIGLL